MALTKMKNSRRDSTQKAFESRESREFRSEREDLRLGMERRKFSYTIHIPERRSDQNQLKPE